MKRWLLTAIVLTSFSVFALDFTITFDTPTGSAAQQTLTSLVNSELNSDLPDVSIAGFSEGVAASTYSAFASQATDYADEPDLFMVKLTGGAAVQGGDLQDTDELQNADGFGAAGGLTLGLNGDVLPFKKLWFIEAKKLDLFLSFFSYGLDETNDDTRIEGDISSFGLMGRYHWIDGVDIVPGKMVRWEGVHIHTGLQYAKMGIDVTTSFDDQTVKQSGSTVATFSSTTATVGIESTTWTIPIEISTAIRLAYAFSFYGGAGFDLVSSNADIDLTAGGRFTGAGVFAGENGAITTSTDDSGSGDVTNFRAFAGAQINVPLFRVYVHYGRGLGNDTEAVHAGLKFVF